MENQTFFTKSKILEKVVKQVQHDKNENKNIKSLLNKIYGHYIKMNLEDLFKIISLVLGGLFLPFLVDFIIFKEYVNKKAGYIILFFFFIAFCINFFICNLGEIIATIAACTSVVLIYCIIFAFIVCNVSNKKTFLNKFNLLIFSLLLILFLTSPLLLLAIADGKYKYNYEARIKVKKVAATICVFPIIKAEIYQKLAYDNLNYNQEEVIKNYELAYKYDDELYVNLLKLYLTTEQYSKAEELVKKENDTNGEIDVLLAEGRNNEAEELARNSGNIDRLIDILLSLGKNNEALEIAKKKLGETSQNRIDHEYFIRIYLSMNDYENAQKHVQIALDIPYDGKIFTMNSEPFYAYQSVIYAKKGDIANAKKEYKKTTDNYDFLFEKYNIDVNLLKDN